MSFDPPSEVPDYHYYDWEAEERRRRNKEMVSSFYLCKPPAKSDDEPDFEYPEDKE